jgi:hypothetical protein
MRLPDSRRTADEQRVVDLSRQLGNRQRRRMRKAVGGSDDERLEGVARFEGEVTRGRQRWRVARDQLDPAGGRVGGDRGVEQGAEPAPDPFARAGGGAQVEDTTLGSHGCQGFDPGSIHVRRQGTAQRVIDVAPYLLDLIFHASSTTI